MLFQLKVTALVSLMIVPAMAAAASASSGTITFTGSIVEGGCSLQPSQQAVQVQCPSGTSTVNVQSQADLQRLSAQASQISSAKMDWLDRNHRLGVMTITYQ